MLDILLGAAMDWIQKNPSRVAYGAHMLYNSAKKSYDSNKRIQEWRAGSEERARRKPKYSAILREFYATQIEAVIQELKNADSRVCGLSEQTLRQFAEKRFADTLEARMKEAEEKLKRLKSLFKNESRQCEADDKLRSIWASASSACEEYANTYAQILACGKEDDFSKMLLMEKANALHLNDSQIKCAEKILNRCGGDTHSVSQFFQEGDAKVKALENLRNEIVATRKVYKILKYWVYGSKIQLEADGDEYWLDEYRLLDGGSDELDVQEKMDDEELARFESNSDADGCEPENTVFLDDVGENKIAVIKVLRDYTGMGLKSAKDFVDSAPCSLSDVDNAEDMVRDLQSAGADVRYVCRL